MLVPHLSAPEPAESAVLDRPAWTGPEVCRRLDRVTRTATLVSDLPIAMVSVLDAGRPCPASLVGAAPDTAITGELSWLAGLVATTGPVEVADFNADPRFRDRPPSGGGPRLRSYLGAPVRSEDGRTLATLGLADVRPHELPPVLPRLVADLAGWVEAELRHGDECTLALERMKDEFLATVSHELRTPLTSVKGALALSLSGVMGGMDDEVRSVLEVGLENTDRLVRLVNDIVDLERLLGGQLPLAPTDTDALTLVTAAVEPVRRRAVAAGVDIEVAVDPAALFVDVERTVQVLGHLVANAVKFSPPRGVVTVTSTTSAEGVVFVVTDQGPGVPAEARERIFERFAHADASDRREQPGSGLGLPLARSLAEQQGGWLEVASEPGAGASFRLTLPPAVRSKVVL